MVWTAVVGSLIAGDSALIAISTRSRMGYFGSCSNVRSRPRRTARRSASSGSGVPHHERAEELHPRPACRRPRTPSRSFRLPPAPVRRGRRRRAWRWCGACRNISPSGSPDRAARGPPALRRRRRRRTHLEAPEHLADDGAPLVADQLQHVADLKVAEALHQPRERSMLTMISSHEKRREQRNPSRIRRGPPRRA